MKASTIDVILVALGVVGAVAGVSAFYRSSESAAVATAAPVPVENWNELKEGATPLGAAEAQVTIVEFADFQCPYCANMVRTLDAIESEHPGRVAVLFRHFPLTSIHPHAYEASVAAECASRQGRFAKFYRLLFGSQHSIGVTPWSTFARQAGVRDTLAFNECVSANQTRERVDHDVQLARRLGLNGTPTLIVNGQLYQSALAPNELERIVNSITPTESAR